MKSEIPADSRSVWSAPHSGAFRAVEYTALQTRREIWMWLFGQGGSGLRMSSQSCSQISAFGFVSDFGFRTSDF